jgi:hypothetical protein
MYHGHTGRKLQAQVYLGPTYYQVRCPPPSPSLSDRQTNSLFLASSPFLRYASV